MIRKFSKHIQSGGKNDSPNTPFQNYQNSDNFKQSTHTSISQNHDYPDTKYDTNNYNNFNNNNNYDKGDDKKVHKHQAEHNRNNNTQREQYIYGNLHNTDDYTTNRVQPLPRPDIGIFMDSNRRDINFDNLFVNEKVKVIPCGTVIYALKIVHQRDFVAPKTAIIHLGTNDINHGTPEEFLEALKDLVHYLSEKGSVVYVSELLPRTDGNKPMTVKVNALLRDVIPMKHLIPHPHITYDHLYDEVHLRHNPNDGEKYSGTQLLAADFYRCQYGKDPMDSRISRSRGDQRKPRKRSNSRNRSVGH